MTLQNGNRVRRLAAFADIVLGGEFDIPRGIHSRKIVVGQ